MEVDTKGCCSGDFVPMDVESGSIAPNNTLPEEILVDLFSYLHLTELSTCALTCKKWHQVASDSKLLSSAISITFENLLPELDKKNSYIGPETLKRCIGEFGEAPPLTGKILKELQSPDPQNEGKKKKETHILALIPDRIGKNPLTLNSLNQFKNFRYYSSKIKDNKEYGDKPYPKTRWVLMTKDVLNGSRGKSRDEQLEMASNHGEGYRAPTLLEAAFINTMLFVSKEIRLLSVDPWTYTCCLDDPIDGWKLVVGGFDSSGLCVYYYVSDYDYVGALALRRF